MTKDVNEIKATLVSLLKNHAGSFKTTADNGEKFEVCGTIPTMQGKQKVDGIYFASVVPKPKDVRLYFFPVYTHKEEVGDLSENLQKALKGKSCFHIKYMDEDREKDLKNLIDRSVEVYRKAGLLK
ncbi:MAG: hypothetical protein ACPG21_06280 [Crocinitomicaceae bacterium]